MHFVYFISFTPNEELTHKDRFLGTQIKANSVDSFDEALIVVWQLSRENAFEFFFPVVILIQLNTVIGMEFCFIKLIVFPKSYIFL